MTTLATMDELWQKNQKNRLGSDVGINLQWEVPLFLEIPEFPYNKM